MSKNNIKFKTPITYYGGKQTMANIIIQMMPEHKLYCEPFAGGASVFFVKAPSEIEVLNDTNRELENFYKVVKNDFNSLKKEIENSLNSRDLYRRASVIYNNPDMFSEVMRAWALWVLSSQSFGSQIDGSWSYDKSKNRIAKKVQNKKKYFTEELATRLQNCSIESADACYVIRSRDTENSLYYCDPPYYNANMGHYGEYSLGDFRELLETLSKIKGKFILSSYPSEILDEYINKYNWFSKSFDMRISVNATKDTKQKRKTEVLTTNYYI